MTSLTLADTKRQAQTSRYGLARSASQVSASKLTERALKRCMKISDVTNTLCGVRSTSAAIRSSKSSGPGLYEVLPDSDCRAFADSGVETADIVGC